MTYCYKATFNIFRLSIWRDDKKIINKIIFLKFFGNEIWLTYQVSTNLLKLTKFS